MKLIAFHLPQFHPIPENSKWWGAGFSEWRNVANARPLFRGHQQPNLPEELGFYDLRLEQTLIDQADLATWAGLSGFCYYHYWFAGRLLLEKPLELLLSNKTPDFPFCLCWANHSWTAHWVGRNDMLIEQTYPGKEDHRAHYEYLRRFFNDKRYIRINQKPLLLIFKPWDIPELEAFVNLIKAWALKDGLGGLHLVGLDNSKDLLKLGFDAIAPHGLNNILKRYCSKKKNKFKLFLKYKVLRFPRWVVDYSELLRLSDNFLCDGVTTIPTVIPNWDNTPRVGRKGVVLSGSSPEHFFAHLNDSIRGLDKAGQDSEKIVLIKSWNEWAEGNYLEPDLKYGRGWLAAVRSFLETNN